MSQLTLKKQSRKNVSTDQALDEGLVNAIREGKLIQIPWENLTEDEKRAARNMIFRPCEF